MDVDGKTLAMLGAALIGGGGSGVVTSELNVQAEFAAIHAELDGMRENIDILVGKGEAANTEIRSRIDRLDARKVDKVQ